MVSKAQIFNQALGALLLQRQISDPSTDKSNEAKVLQGNWGIALRTTLEDLDLDATSTQSQLELVTTFDQTLNPPPLWFYAYKYPNNCAFFRRIQSCVRTDSRYTHIAKRIAIHQGQKVIFTNQLSAIGEFIPFDLPLAALSANAALAVAYRLAILSSPLIVGKGSKTLIEQIGKSYVITKAEAQAQDERESFSFEDDATISEFVAARLS